MRFFFIRCSNFVKEFLFLKQNIRLLNNKITAEDTFLQSEPKKKSFKSNDTDPKEKTVFSKSGCNRFSNLFELEFVVHYIKELLLSITYFI